MLQSFTRFLSFLTAFFWAGPRKPLNFAGLLPGAAIPKRTLPPGRYIQVYRDAIRGRNQAAKMAAIATALDQFKAVGVKGVLWHGFVGEMDAAKFKELSAMCASRGLFSLAAFGLGPSEPEKSGKWIGEIANLPECFAVVFDMEGAWEIPSGKTKAMALGKAFRDVAPNALALDQPWADPTVHWSLFPWEETAVFIDARYPQFYVNNWFRELGEKRYAQCWTRFLKAWERLNARLAAKNLVRPVSYTIQGYKWVFRDLVNCLTTNPTLIIWTDPFPDEITVAALKAVHALESQGFHGPNAVKDFQAKWNKDHPGDSLTTDNLCGPATMNKLGLPPPPPSS